MRDPDVDRLASEVEATARELSRLGGVAPHGIPRTRPGDDGEPYFGRDDTGWFYAARERGEERWRRRTGSERELSTWLVDELVHLTAYENGWRNRSAGQDARRGWFADWSRLAHLLGPDVGRRADEAVAQILEQSPFRDPG